MIRRTPMVWVRGCLLVGTWLVLVGPLFAGQIRWSGPARFYLADGVNYDTEPALGNPLFTVNPPVNATRVFAAYPGLSFQLSLTMSGPRNARLRAGVIPSLDARVNAPAGLVPVETAMRRRVVIEADYRISQVDTIPTTMLVEASAGVGATGSVVNTAGQIDEAESEATVTLSETTDVQGAILVSDFMSRSYHVLDGVPQPVADPTDLKPIDIIDRHNGLYRLRVEVDLGARVFGNVGEERASATWNQFVDVRFSLFDFSGTVPEPETLSLVLLGVVIGLMTVSRRPKSRPVGWNRLSPR